MCTLKSNNKIRYTIITIIINSKTRTFQPLVMRRALIKTYCTCGCGGRGLNYRRRKKLHYWTDCFHSYQHCRKFVVHFFSLSNKIHHSSFYVMSLEIKQYLINCYLIFTLQSHLHCSIFTASGTGISCIDWMENY